MKRFFETGETKGLPPQAIAKRELVLDALDAAHLTRELDLPGFHLHLLSGNRKGLWSIRVTKNWRVVFRFEDAENETVTIDEFGAYEVDYEDYH